MFRDNETAIHDAPLFSWAYSIWAKFRGRNIQSRAALSECTRMGERTRPFYQAGRNKWTREDKLYTYVYRVYTTSLT